MLRYKKSSNLLNYDPFLFICNFLRGAKNLMGFIGHLLWNKAGYTATPVACGWAGAVMEVTRSFGQEQ